VTAVLSPLPKQQFLDNNGNPLVGGKLFAYIAGTSTKQATYVDSAGVTQNANPVILDFRGEANVWLPPNVGYKFVLAPANDTDPPGNPFWSVDNVISSQLLTLYGGIDTGIANAYVLNFTANFTAYTDGIVIYWIPSNSNTGASTINVNGLGAVPIINADGSPLSANEIQANVPATILYQGSTFILTTPASLNTGGTFTLTVVGCTTAPTKTATWARSGRIVTIVVPATGFLVSNSTSFGYSGIPASLQLGVGATGVGIYGMGAIDNGVATYAAGSVGLSAASGSFNFFHKGGSWTAAGTKSMDGFVITYPVSSNFS